MKLKNALKKIVWCRLSHYCPQPDSIILMEDHEGNHAIGFITANLEGKSDLVLLTTHPFGHPVLWIYLPNCGVLSHTFMLTLSPAIYRFSDLYDNEPLFVDFNNSQTKD